MTLTPDTILKHLGFDVPPEGVEINPDDVFFHAAMLTALGKTMALQRATDDELGAMLAGLAGIVSEWRGTPTATPGMSLTTFREVLTQVLRTIYGKSP